MNKVSKTIFAATMAIAMAFGLCGCRESTRVSYNVSKEADNFNVMRKITVVNVRNDSVLFELTGKFSLENSDESELTVICETDEGVYKKDFIYLNEWTTYVVEDLDGNDVNQYKYELNILPQMVGGSTITMND